MIFRRKKTISIINPTSDLIERLVQEGIDSFKIDKINNLTSLTIKNDRKTRKLLKKLDLNDKA